MECEVADKGDADTIGDAAADALKELSEIDALNDPFPEPEIETEAIATFVPGVDTTTTTTTVYFALLLLTTHFTNYMIIDTK